MFNSINRAIKRMVIRRYKSRPEVLISDTTLRDGAQMPGIALDVEQKVAIASALSRAGVHSIDTGFPASSRSEVESIKAIASAVRGTILSCLCRTKVSDIDAAAEALSGYSAYKRAATLFIGTSPLHREHKHNMSRSEIIKTAVAAIEHAQDAFQIISFGAEDASRTEPEFLHEIYEKAIQAGATSVGFTDTVGVLTPRKAGEAIQRIYDNVPSIGDALLAVHFHNDLGLATANTLAAIEAGANVVQGTINGIGERAGNVPIEEVVVALALNESEYGRTTSVDPSTFCSLSQLVEKLTGWRPADNKPVVGRNIFRTEAGIHQDGLLKNPDTYLPFRPELVGADPVEFVFGPGSGRKAVRHHLERQGFEPTDDQVNHILAHIKGDATASVDKDVEEMIRTMLEIDPKASDPQS